MKLALQDEQVVDDSSCFLNHKSRQSCEDEPGVCVGRSAVAIQRSTLTSNSRDTVTNTRRVTRT